MFTVEDDKTCKHCGQSASFKNYLNVDLYLMHQKLFTIQDSSVDHVGCHTCFESFLKKSGFISKRESAEEIEYFFKKKSLGVKNMKFFSRFFNHKNRRTK